MGAVRAYEAPPPGANVWWVARYGDSTAHIFTRTWFDARATACAELECCQDAIVITLDEPLLMSKDGSNV